MASLDNHLVPIAFPIDHFPAIHVALPELRAEVATRRGGIPCQDFLVTDSYYILSLGAQKQHPTVSVSSSKVNLAPQEEPGVRKEIASFSAFSWQGPLPENTNQPLGHWLHFPPILCSLSKAAKITSN